MVYIITNHCGFQIDEDGTRDMLAGPGLTKEGVEGVVSTPNSLVTGHLTIRLDAVLQAVQLPAGIAHLDSGLADMDRHTFTLKQIFLK